MAFPIDPAELEFFGEGLVRPECVVTGRSGRVYVCDWRGGVVRFEPDGRQSFIGTMHAPGEGPLRPNGITVLPDGSILAANLADAGGVWRIAPDGQTEPFITTCEGEPIPPANYVTRDAAGRIWITVSTRLQPRTRANNKAADDGYIMVSDAAGTRIVAEGFGFTNEVGFHPSGEWAYVNETFGRRLSRLRLHEDGRIGPREVVCEFGPGVFPDGLAFDEEGAIWLTSVISNRLIRVGFEPGSRPEVMLEDADPELDRIEAAYQADEFGADHMNNSRGQRLANLSSLAFGGPDRRTLVLGSLGGDRLARVRSPIAGAEPPHWHWT